MCSHTEQFQYNARLDAPGPIFAKQMQELPGRVKGEEVACTYYNFSEGAHGAQGRWAGGPSIDGKGEFEYVAEPGAMGPEMVELDPPVEARLHSTPKQPIQASSS